MPEAAHPIAPAAHIDITGVQIPAGAGIDPAAVEELRAGMRGDVLVPGDAAYEESRRIWNGMIDRRPGAIARCRGAADVMHAVRFARARRLLVAVRGAGHNIAGNAVCDGGLLIDLSQMKSARVDPASRTARVEPGCTLHDFDHEAQAYGLATPLGINSTTGVAGLTLGGGFGWLSRKHGLTVDNLLSADVVTADGELRRCSETENPELFWAIRGGGGNFGVVTSFEFRLHPVGPTVLSGLVVHPLEDAPEVLRFWRGFVEGLPEEATVWTVMRKAPPLPFLPEAWHGREVLVLAAFHGGDPAEGERLLEPLRAFGNPIADVVGPHPYAGWQQAFDPLLTPGARNYWKSHDFAELSDEALETLLHHVRHLPSPECEVFLAQLGGAVNRVPADATAYPARDVRYVMNVHARWQDPADDAACIGWARDLFAATTRFATGAVYVNFLTQEEGDRVRMAYGANYDRLAEAKARYDPSNLFCMNQNVRPAGQPA